MKALLFNLLVVLVSATGCGDDSSGIDGSDGSVGGDASVPQGDSAVPDGGLDGAASDGAASDGAASDGAASDGAMGSDAGSDAGDAGSPPSTDCPFGGWCWVFPEPFHVRVNAVWGAAPDDVWAVGPRGFIAHFDGTEWSVHPSPVTELDLQAVHGSGPDNVCAVGDDGLALHWNGTAWRTLATPGTPDLADVFIASGSDGWAVGEDRSLLRFDGSAWTLVREEPTFGPYTSVWGSGPDDVWVGSMGDGFDHWDGDAWTYDPGPLFYHRATADIWGSGPNDVWVSSHAVDIRVSHWNGSEWSSRDLPSSVLSASIDGSGSDNVWFIGRSGAAHWNGTELQTVDLVTQEERRDVVVFPGDGWLVGSTGRLFRNDGSEAWTLGAGSGQGYQSVGGLTPAAGGGIYAQATDGVWHYDGGASTRITEMPMSAMHELPSGELIFALGRDIHRWDGAALAPMATGDFGSLNVVDLWGTGPSDVYFAMDRQSIMHWDGSALEFVYGSGSFSTLADVARIEGTAAGDVWAITDEGSILRGDATGFAEVSSDEDVWWTSLRVFASDDVWVGGGGATLWHWDGTTWDATTVPDIQRSTNRNNSPFVVGIAGTGAGDVTAVTDLGHVLRLELGEWVVERTLPMRLNDVTTDETGAHWASGENNLVRRAPW